MQSSEQKSNVYDIANAGPRNRFVVRTKDGPLLVHNCILGLGYAVGAGTLQRSLRNGSPRVVMPIERCKEIVQTYRQGYPMISRLWKSLGRALEAVYQGYDTVVGVGVKLPFKAKPFPHIDMPNGLTLRYPDLQKETNPDTGYDELTYKTRKFRKRIYGGSLTENIVQSLARTAVAYQMCAIKQALDKRSAEKNDGKIRQIVNMVHDEVVTIVPEDEEQWCFSMMETKMKARPAWGKDLPISCEAGSGDTYGDAK